MKTKTITKKQYQEGKDKIMMEVSFALNSLNNNDFKALMGIADSIKQISQQLDEVPKDLFGVVIEI